MSQAPRLRLFLDQPLAAGATLALPRAQAHYVATVMRAQTGEAALVFNGRDGEWLAVLGQVAKAGATLVLRHQTRPQAAEPDLWLLAAPIKREGIDLVAEKAAELGASVLWPVITRRTVVARVNLERLQARLTEAAEQCERLTLPRLHPPVPLERALADWDPARILLVPDETGTGAPLPQVLRDLTAAAAPPPLALLVGPEGGFAPEERAALAMRPFVRPVSLGPRILRAETAAIAALAITQALAGDWILRPRR